MLEEWFWLKNGTEYYFSLSQLICTLVNRCEDDSRFSENSQAKDFSEVYSKNAGIWRNYLQIFNPVPQNKIIIAKPNFQQHLDCRVSLYLSALMFLLILRRTGIKFRYTFNTAEQHFIAQVERVAYF